MQIELGEDSSRTAITASDASEETSILCLSQGIISRKSNNNFKFH